MSITSNTETLRTQVATNNSISTVGVEVMANAMGKDLRSNESVRATPDKSDLTDALEELGMSVAARGKPDIDKLKVRRGASSDVDALSRIAEYLDQLPSMPSEEKYLALVKKLTTYLERIEGGSGSSDQLLTADDLRNMLTEFDGDITHQAVALERLRNQLLETGASPEVLKVVDAVRQEFASPESLREIKAGLAAGREAHQLGERFGSDAHSFRESYRELLRDPSPRLGPVFDTLRKFSLTDNFDEVIESFLRVAGTDLSSFGPSVDPIALNDLITELAKLKNLRTVLKTSEDIEMKISRAMPGTSETRPKGEEIASRLLHFAGNSLPTLGDATNLLRGYEQDNPEVSVLAINLLRGAHAQLPDKIMPTAQARDQQSRLLMLVSDKTVEIEEQSFGS